MNAVKRNNVFSSRILWTDEAIFKRRFFNSHNSHVWVHNNPHSTRQRNFQREFRCNVCMNMLNDDLQSMLRNVYNFFFQIYIGFVMARPFTQLKYLDSISIYQKAYKQMEDEIIILMNEKKVLLKIGTL